MAVFQQLICFSLVLLMSVGNVKLQTTDVGSTVGTVISTTLEDFTGTTDIMTTDETTSTPTDLLVSSFAFNDSDTTFDLDVDNIYTMVVTIKNDDNAATLFSVLADSAAGNDDDDNYAVYFVVSDTDDLSDASATTIYSEADTSSVADNNMIRGMAGGNSLVLDPVYAMINVPKADCNLYQYLCVKVNQSSTAVWTDGDSTNNYQCVDAFGATDADYLECSGCIARFSGLLILLALVANLLSL